MLGGSFDPPHAGHLHISLWAARHFGLDQVWWLISPRNPLKSRRPDTVSNRERAARQLVHDPRLLVVGIEERIGTRYSCDTIAWLKERYLRSRFVWLMGADNLAQFHLWKEWQEILKSVPVGVIARHGWTTAARSSHVARRMGRFRVRTELSRALPYCKPPAWILMNAPSNAVTSTALRDEWAGRLF